MIKLKNKIILFISLFFLILAMPKLVKANSLSVSASNTSVDSGSTVNISVSTDCIGRFNVSVSNGTNNGSSKYWLESSSTSFSVKVGQSGTTTVTVTPANPVSNASGSKVDLGSKSVSINIKGNSGGTSSSSNSSNAGSGGNTGSPASNSDTTSSGKTVKMISTSPADFSGFKAASKGPYRVTVENNVSQLKAVVKYSDGSTNTVIKNLQEGSNSFYVEGYNIIAVRKTAEGEEIVPNTIDEEQQEENQEEEQQVLRLNNIVLDDSLNIRLDPNFDPEVFDYTVVLGNEYLDLTELLINAMANIEGATITIDGNKDLIDGENIVTITVEANGYETVWYRIKVIKGAVEETVETIATEKTDFNAGEILKNKIITSVGVLLILFIGIIAIAKECYESTNSDEYKNKKAQKKRINEYDYEDEDVDEDEDEYESEDEDTQSEEVEENESEDNVIIDSFENAGSTNLENNKTDYNSIISDIENKAKTTSNNDTSVDSKESKDDLEKIKEEFFKADKIEFDYEETKPRRTKGRHGKGKHS